MLVFVPSVTLLVSHGTLPCTQQESTFATEDLEVTSPVLLESCVPQGKPVVWSFPFYHSFVSRDVPCKKKKGVSNKIGCIFISSEKPELVEFSAVINLKQNADQAMLPSCLWKYFHKI